MRLINTQTLNFEEYEGSDVPQYAILSHRWGAGEVLYAEFTPGADVSSKPGWNKILKCCEQAREDNLAYVWIDTCCIDKSSSAELTEAINSMFKWYEESTVCYAYLYDVDASTLDTTKMRQLETTAVHRHLSRNFLIEFYDSAWFTRGWTLQELLAPKHMKFFNCHWEELGSTEELCNALTCVTCIPAEALLHQRKLASYTVAQRMSWASKRSTTRIEDRAYSLLGIFDVNMPLLYGEREAAFVRLQEEILRRSNDESILLWEAEDLSLLAKSPTAFAIHLPHISKETMLKAELSTQYPINVDFRCRYRKQREPCTLTNVGLSITLLLVPWCIDVYLVKLQVEKRVRTGNRVQSYDAGIFLRQTVNDSRLARAQVGNETIRWLESTSGKSLSNEFLQSTGTVPRPHVIAHDDWDTSAGEGYLHSWNAKKQRYGFKFNFQKHPHWGPTKTLEADDIISRCSWNPQERTLALDPGGFEVLAIFRIQGAKRWPYVYFGFTPDFIPTMVQKDWHFQTPFKGFDAFRNTYPMRQDLNEALSYSHFWESIKRSDPGQELVVQGSQDPHKIIRARTDVDGLSLMITRWTSGYAFDFVKAEHTKALTIPKKTKDASQPVRNPSAYAISDQVNWDIMPSRAQQPEQGATAEVGSPRFMASEVSDSVALPPKSRPLKQAATTGEFQEIELFIVNPPPAAARRAADKHTAAAERATANHAVQNDSAVSPTILINGEEVQEGEQEF